MTKILANKIVSLYSIFFSKIWYLYRFKRFIFEYRCPPLLTTVDHIHLHKRANFIGNDSLVQGIHLPSWSVLQTGTHHCGPHPPAQKGQFYWQWHSCPGHAQLECPPDRDSPLWNHIYLHKSGYFVCHGIPVHSSSCPVIECPPVRDSPLWNQIHLHKKEILFAVLFFRVTSQLASWSVLLSQSHHCGTTSICTKGGILVRASSCPVEVSCRQTLITMEQHPPEQKGQSLFAVVFLSIQPAARLECSPDRDSPLWNHIHLCKRGNFFDDFILVRASSCPVGFLVL